MPQSCAFPLKDDVRRVILDIQVCSCVLPLEMLQVCTLCGNNTHGYCCLCFSPDREFSTSTCLENLRKLIEFCGGSYAKFVGAVLCDVQNSAAPKLFAICHQWLHCCYICTHHSKAACSMFGVNGSATPDGRLLQLRAFDWHMDGMRDSTPCIH